MKTVTALKTLAIGTVVGAVAFAAAGDAMAQKKVKWKMQSAWGTQVPNAGESGVRFVDSVTKMSGGKFAIKFFGPGALVPALETFGAAESIGGGAVDDRVQLGLWSPGVPALSRV